jgi:hypothetical protein
VRYTITDTYQAIGLFRDEDDDMDELYNLHGIQVAPNLEGVFTDTLVTNGHEYCYIAVAVDTEARRSAPSAPSCAVPNTDPLPPRGAILINGGAQSTPVRDVNLTLWASDSVDPEVHDFGPDHTPPADSASGVTQMMISNLPDLSDGVWEPYDTSKPWTLAQTAGLASVYVKYMDAVGNVSETYVATIWIGKDPARKALYLTLIPKQ